MKHRGKTKEELLRELERLQGQVDELTHAEAGCRDTERALRTIAEGVSAAVGDTFFQSLVEHLAKTLGARYALVGELSDKAPDTVTTVAFFAEGTIAPNFDYSLKDTPCENVMKQSLRCYPREVRKRFSRDRLLVEMGVESYIGTPLLDSAKRVIGIVVVMDDKPFTRPEQAESLLRIFASRASSELERKQMEEQLRASEFRFRELVHGMSSGVAVYEAKDGGADFTLVDFNPAAERASKTRKKDIIGKSVLTAFPGVRDLGLFDVLVRVWKTGVPESHPAAPYRDPERSLWVENYVFKLPAGEVIAVFNDVTERKRMEEELLKAHKLESLGILAGGLAHDFNNLLTGILGNIEMAKLYADPNDKVYERLAEAGKAFSRAKDLTRQLLTFSRGGEPARKTIAIGPLVKEAANFSLRGSNIRCEFFIPEDIPPVEADEGQISQVINNLIINACQAMPGGGAIALRCETASVKPEDTLPLKVGAYVKIDVQDHGIGIPEEHIPNIFDPYFTTKQGGSGLGLATSYSIVKRHDGYIAVETEPGKGTTFHIYLPASPGKAAAKKTAEEFSVKGTGRILLMDDEEVVRNAAGEMLRYLGYEVEFAADGAQAIERYHEARDSGRPFGAVIMDLTVPGGMGGREAVRKLRETAPEAKVIVSSGYSSDPVLANYAAYGFCGIVTKPYNVNELGKTVHQALSARE